MRCPGCVQTVVCMTKRVAFLVDLSLFFGCSRADNQYAVDFNAVLKQFRSFLKR